MGILIDPSTSSSWTGLGQIHHFLSNQDHSYILATKANTRRFFPAGWDFSLPTQGRHRDTDGL